MNSSGEPASPVPQAILKRRARNRASQKTFRDRQARRVKELEASLADRTRESSDELIEARRDACRLREALTATKTRILDLRDSLATVAENIDISLGHVPGARNSQAGLDNATLAPAVEVNSDTSLDEPELQQHETSDTRIMNEPTEETSLMHGQPEGATQEPSTLGDAAQVLYDGATDQPGHGTASTGIQIDDVVHLQIPASTSNLQCGEANYQKSTYPLWHSGDGTTRAFPTLVMADTPKEQPEVPPFALSFPPGVITFPSVFSAHIGVIEYFAKKSAAYVRRTEVDGAEAYSKLVTTMVNMFVTTCWPDMCTWWTYIQSSMVVEKLMRWKLDSCVDTYKLLPVTHRPTALQVCTVYPPIIDWVFFPSVRDRMIELYSDNWVLDEIVCELLYAYVVEADLSSLVTGLETLPPQRGYFRMWDIVQTISNNMQQRSPNSQGGSANWMQELRLEDDLFATPTDLFEFDHMEAGMSWTKMPLDRIYQSPQAAWRLFRLLRMEDRRAVKVDPVFAATHPELCDDHSIVAKGIDCTLQNRSTRVPRPKPLTREAIINYKMIICNS